VQSLARLGLIAGTARHRTERRPIIQSITALMHFSHAPLSSSLSYTERFHDCTIQRQK